MQTLREIQRTVQHHVLGQSLLETQTKKQLVLEDLYHATRDSRKDTKQLINKYLNTDEVQLFVDEKLNEEMTHYPDKSFNDLLPNMQYMILKNIQYEVNKIFEKCIKICRNTLRISYVDT